MVRKGVAVGVGAIGLALAGGPAALAAPAPSPVVVAQWAFDDPAGSTSVTDVTGRGHDLTVDPDYPDVTFGVADPQVGTVAHYNGALTLAASQPDLVPGDANISVTVQIRTDDPGGYANFFQKGTFTSKGGYWKIEMARGQARCRFNGADSPGHDHPAMQGDTVINDGAWHTITCTKTASRTTLTVDGTMEKARHVTIGAITNTAPVAVGGKYLKSGARVDEEDMLHGDINLASYRLG